MQNLFIGIAGIIGAGKTTLTHDLAARLDYTAYYEPVKDNEYLADFYRDPQRYAFTMQIYLLHKRFAQHQQIVWHSGGAVQDRTIYEDTVFARMLWQSGLMDERDYRTYIGLFNSMANFLCKPNAIIYLDVSPEVAICRIQERGRECEKMITLRYLNDLYWEYEIFVDDMRRHVPVFALDWNEYGDVESVAEFVMLPQKFSFLRQVVK